MGANQFYNAVMDELRHGIDECDGNLNEFSRRCGVAQPTIYNWLNKGTAPNLRDIGQIMDFLRVHAAPERDKKVFKSLLLQVDALLAKYQGE